MNLHRSFLANSLKSLSNNFLMFAVAGVGINFNPLAMRLYSESVTWYLDKLSTYFFALVNFAVLIRCLRAIVLRALRSFCLCFLDLLNRRVMFDNSSLKISK